MFERLESSCTSFLSEQVRHTEPNSTVLYVCDWDSHFEYVPLNSGGLMFIFSGFFWTSSCDGNGLKSLVLSHVSPVDSD